MNNHSYLPFAKDLESSERQHLLMLNHFAKSKKIDPFGINPDSFERFAKTSAEHEKTKIAIRTYPNKNHRP